MSPRDKLADAAYFTAKIAEETAYLEADKARIEQFIADKGEKASGRAKEIFQLQVICASMAYSRGDAIDDVRERIVSAFLDLKYLHQLYAKYPDEIRVNRGSYWDALRRLTYAVAYFPGQEGVDRAIYDVEFFGKTDPILVAMLDWLKGNPIRRDREDSELDFPESFIDLWHAISYPRDEQAGALKRYIENWYEDNLKIRGEGAPGIGSHEKMIRYQGYWCWEAAAVAIMMDIDDTTFRDHEHYPKDLVAWARTRKGA